MTAKPRSFDYGCASAQDDKKEKIKKENLKNG